MQNIFQYEAHMVAERRVCIDSNFCFLTRHSFDHNISLEPRNSAIRHSTLFYLSTRMRWSKGCLDLMCIWSRAAWFVLTWIFALLIRTVGVLRHSATILTHFSTLLRVSIFSLFDCWLSKRESIQETIFQGIPTVNGFTGRKFVRRGDAGTFSTEILRDQKIIRSLYFSRLPWKWASEYCPWKWASEYCSSGGCDPRLRSSWYNFYVPRVIVVT